MEKSVLLRGRWTWAVVVAVLAVVHSHAPAQDGAVLIQMIDAAAQARFQHVVEFTVTEHYAVFRGKDEGHPAAEMTVLTTYRKDAGKTYAILSQSGSPIIQKFGLRPLLDNEKKINNPATVKNSWFTSTNYEMRLKSGARREMDGRDCVAFAITPRRKAPNMIEGELWIDATDGSIVEIDGLASKSPSVFAGSTKMMRHYINIDGYAMATHARAESNSALFGRTVVTIDYRDYNIETH